MSSDGYIIISHYQKSIRKARNDETKLLHCIGKLFELPITIDHLQKTGIGKTVNSLRKYEGEVGTAAKRLVAKWKSMVATDEMSNKEERCKVMGNECERSNVKSRNCDPIPTNDSNNSKDSMNEYKLIQNNSHTNNHKSRHHRDKDIHISSRSSVSRNNEHIEKDNKEPKEKEKRHKSRHSEKYNSKSKSNSNISLKAEVEDISSHTLQSDTMSNGCHTSLDSSDRRSEKHSDVSEQIVHHKPKRAKIVVDDGIDSSMGASFSDALGMCGKASKKYKKTQKNSIVPKAINETCDQKTVSNKLNIIPEALRTLPPPTKIDISFNLPMATPVLKITDNYKPAPINQNVMNCIFPSMSSEKTTISHDDAITIGISSKTMRTKVYSGVKTGAILIVPSLFDICIRVLQKNIDALEYTGGVPFDVLRPVLERTTPQQLLSFEDYNAYLLEDTDVLWQQHVGRHFRGVMKQEGETWREMFLRCEDDKERRLNILTKNIKISQKQSALPVRKTRLAYVDNVVKPPRNIQRKQEQYGTTDKLIASPAARVAALSSASHNAVKAGDPRLRISRELAQTAGVNQLRVKKAPLMAKTLQFIKKRYKK